MIYIPKYEHNYWRLCLRSGSGCEEGRGEEFFVKNAAWFGVSVPTGVFEATMALMPTGKLSKWTEC